ncbi:hypothetical protein H6P81_014323 [Aristolochia fimbriata]|uniref:Uncharacterized protein n=1 Tax=Aristolochia fimbriata TaxID=158543 RepID=A0AAV7EJB5_ARIFI|nr:hypothetical protein H6P81_014323 [Aristolochia fimbriata]
MNFTRVCSPPGGGKEQKQTAPAVRHQLRVKCCETMRVASGGDLTASKRASSRQRPPEDRGDRERERNGSHEIIVTRFLLIAKEPRRAIKTLLSTLPVTCAPSKRLRLNGHKSATECVPIAGVRPQPLRRPPVPSRTCPLPASTEGLLLKRLNPTRSINQH